MGNVSDKALFKGLREGSETAFRTVYEVNRNTFLNFAKKYGLGTEDVLDIYQDAYVALYENIQNGKFTELKSSLSTYLISIGKYMILEKLRKNKKTVKSESILEVSQDVDETLENFEVVETSLNPRQQLLHTHFERLGEKCKTILKMFYYKKYSIKQIMEEGGYNSENVVKSQKSRCLKSLKDAMKNAENHG